MLLRRLVDDCPNVVAIKAEGAKSAAAAQLHGGTFVNRQAWKFPAWLQGYNGGPLRQPTQRVHDVQMQMLRQGLIDSGLAPCRPT